MTWDEWIGSLDGRPTMWVKHLFCRAGCHIDLHKMIRADDPDCFHTHPAFAIRVILLGGYYEEILDSSGYRLWIPGRIGLVRPDLCHRIAGLRRSTSYSLWIRFRKVAKVQLRGEGWPAPLRVTSGVLS